MKAAGIDLDLPVWEIQPEGDTYHLLLMGKESKKIRETEKPNKITVSEAEEEACRGLMKAALWCRRNNISLLRILKGGFRLPDQQSDC